jgi:hypothetical protein
MRKRKSSDRDYFHAGRKAKFAEKLFAVFPRQTEGAYVGNTEAGEGVPAPTARVCWGGFAFDS